MDGGGSARHSAHARFVKHALQVRRYSFPVCAGLLLHCAHSPFALQQLLHSTGSLRPGAPEHAAHTLLLSPQSDAAQAALVMRVRGHLERQRSHDALEDAQPRHNSNPRSSSEVCVGHIIAQRAAIAVLFFAWPAHATQRGGEGSTLIHEHPLSSQARSLRHGLHMPSRTSSLSSSQKRHALLRAFCFAAYSSGFRLL